MGGVAQVPCRHWTTRSSVSAAARRTACGPELAEGTRAPSQREVARLRHDDLVQRQFHAPRADAVWLTDITEYPTVETAGCRRTDRIRSRLLVRVASPADLILAVNNASLATPLVNKPESVG